MQSIPIRTLRQVYSIYVNKNEKKKNINEANQV